MEHYCTYFDRNYLSRGLALLGSLRQHAGPFHLHILCLDADTHAYFLETPSADITPVPLTALEDFDQGLAAVKSGRRLVEYYFTCTPAWCRFLLNTRPEISQITYLDADLYFFQSPSRIFDELRGHSVGIIPHRFSDANYQARVAGIFNVGWITWRRDGTGLACLEDYRRECLQWCHDYHDGIRFADQRYLDDWPSRYPNVRVMANKGANLAPWNIDTYPLTMRAGDVFVGDDPLIFYHFHGLKQLPNGSFERDLEGYIRNSPCRPDEGILDRVYRPYEELITGKTGAPASTGIRYKASRHPLADLPEWEYLPDGWPMISEGVPGWNLQSVVDAFETRLRIMQRRQEATVPLGSDLNMHNSLVSFGYVLARAGMPGGKLSILDWGGGLGMHRVAAKLLLPELEIAFHCQEVPVVGSRGRELMPDVHFLADGEVPLSQAYKLVMANNALHYARDWQTVLSGLADSSSEWLYISRLPTVMSVPSYVTLQRFFHTDYQTASPCWAINRLEFLNLLSGRGFVVEREFYSPDRPLIPGAPEHVEYSGFLLRRGGPHSSARG